MKRSLLSYIEAIKMFLWVVIAFFLCTISIKTSEPHVLWDTQYWVRHNRAAIEWAGMTVICVLVQASLFFQHFLPIFLRLWR